MANPVAESRDLLFLSGVDAPAREGFVKGYGFSRAEETELRSRPAWAAHEPTLPPQRPDAKISPWQSVDRPPLLEELGRAAEELNISRQAVIKTFIRYALDQGYLARRGRTTGRR